MGSVWRPVALLPPRSIADDLGRSWPNIETLVLTGNQLSTLKELEPLAGMKTLTMLSLVDNPVRAAPTAARPLLRVALLPQRHLGCTRTRRPDSWTGR